jgi:hypothetical protein
MAQPLLQNGYFPHSCRQRSLHAVKTRDLPMNDDKDGHEQ